MVAGENTSGTIRVTRMSEIVIKNAAVTRTELTLRSGYLSADQGVRTV